LSFSGSPSTISQGGREKRVGRENLLEGKELKQPASPMDLGLDGKTGRGGQVLVDSGKREEGKKVRSKNPVEAVVKLVSEKSKTGPGDVQKRKDSSLKTGGFSSREGVVGTREATTGLIPKDGPLKKRKLTREHYRRHFRIQRKALGSGKEKQREGKNASRIIADEVNPKKA